jgi:hypothetical protein
MVKETYEKAYVEVLEVLKYIPQKDYNKIPCEKIEFYNKNKDSQYAYKFDETLPIEEQKLSKKARVILISLFRDYLATETQKKEINAKIANNTIEIEKRKRAKYNPSDIFKKVEKEENVKNNASISLIEHKKSFFTKFKNFILKIVHIKQ